MKLIKGIIIGSAVTAGVLMMCSEEMINKRKWVRKGKQVAKKLGIY